MDDGNRLARERDEGVKRPEGARPRLPWSGEHMVAFRVRFVGEGEERGLAR